MTVSRLCKSAGIGGYKTNHSLRVTAATRLYQAGVMFHRQLIMKRTGHRSIEGVRVYKRASDDQEQVVSAILQRSSTSTNLSIPLSISPSPKRPKNAISDVPSAFNLTNCTNVTITIHK